MPPPLTPVVAPEPVASAKAAPAKRSSWGRVLLYGALFILLLTVGGESAYILYFQEEVVADNQSKPALVVNNPNSPPAATTKPIDVQATSGPSQDAIAAFLEPLNIPVASGSDPRIFVNGAVFHLGQVVAPQFGLRWTSLNDQSRELEFTDKVGHRYIKKF